MLRSDSQQNNRSRTPNTPLAAINQRDDLTGIVAEDARLQRRAMLGMALAMPVMLVGLPLHAATLLGHDHSARLWPLLIVWLSWLLTTATLYVARDDLRASWRGLRHGRLHHADLVALGALAAYAASLPALDPRRAFHAAPMYFDFTAMALAWNLSGAAQAMELRRQFAATIEQLMPLNLDASPAPLPVPANDTGGSGWYAAFALGFALAAAARQLIDGAGLSAALIAGLAALTVACPCTLGIAGPSACRAGAERAAAAGWIVPDCSAFRLPDPPALRLDTADPRTLQDIARAVRGAIRCNYLWALGFNLLSLPLTLFGAVDPLIPAVNMILAWLLILLTSRRIVRHSAAA